MLQLDVPFEIEHIFSRKDKRMKELLQIRIA